MRVRHAPDDMLRTAKRSCGALKQSLDADAKGCCEFDDRRSFRVGLTGLDVRKRPNAHFRAISEVLLRVVTLQTVPAYRLPNLLQEQITRRRLALLPPSALLVHAPESMLRTACCQVRGDVRAASTQSRRCRRISENVGVELVYVGFGLVLPSCCAQHDSGRCMLPITLGDQP